MIYVIQINVKYVFLKKYQARKLFKDILYIPGGSDLERIDLTDDLQLPSNHNRSFTMVILQGQNIDDIWGIAWNFQLCGMCEQQSLRSACAYAQSDQSLC